MEGKREGKGREEKSMERKKREWKEKEKKRRQRNRTILYITSFSSARYECMNLSTDRTVRRFNAWDPRRLLGKIKERVIC